MVKLSHSFSSIKMYENCPHRYYHQRIAKSVTDTGGEASLYGERVHKFLEDRMREGKELPPDVANLEPVVQSVLNLKGDGHLEVEREMTLTKDLSVTTWWAEDAWLRSKLDILILRDERAFVMDWKTGKRRPDFTQLELFALQVFAHYPYVESVRTGFIWIKDSAMDKEVYKRDNSSALWERLLTRIRRIEQSAEKDVWPAKPSGLCNFCPCKSFCEYA